ncbi:hypothetical protein C5C27_16925, partial [Rathayibacter sp. AY2B7]
MPMEGVCTMNQRPPDAWKRSAAATRTASRAVVVPIRAVRRWLAGEADEDRVEQRDRAEQDEEDPAP